MEPSGLPSVLTDLPAIGPLFAGSVVAVVLRLVGILVALVVGIRLLKWAWGRGGERAESERSLVKQGRREEAGDLASRSGNLQTALEHYVAAESWLKAGHTARRLGLVKDAAAHFERARELKLAVASYEAAGMDADVLRLAAHSDDPSLLARAAAQHEKAGEGLEAGHLYVRAGRLRDADRCFLAAGAEGVKYAIKMWIDAHAERARQDGRSAAAREAAGRGAALLARAGDRKRALQLCHQAHIDPKSVEGLAPGPAGSSAPGAAASAAPSGSGGAPGAASPGARKGGRDDLAIDAPIGSADSFIKGMPQARSAARRDLAIESPLESADALAAPVHAARPDADPDPTIPDEEPPARHAPARPSSDHGAARHSPDRGGAARPSSDRGGAARPKTQDVAQALLDVIDDDAGAVGTAPTARIRPGQPSAADDPGSSTIDLTVDEIPPAAALAGPRGAESFGFSSDVTSRYAILAQIGAGGMGEVYKARDLSLGREVALKFLSKKMVGDEMAMKFFLREARSSAALNHPVIVTVYDIGVLDGRPFICMEFVDGTDLGSRLERQGPIGLGHALNLTTQLALALDYAHERNVVHRDIKPPNVIQARGGVIKILDFGLAKAILGGPRKSTVVAGTPEYMSPEQLAGREVDGRTDIFSLGVLLYEVLTNSVPFEGALRSSNFEPVTSRAPWLPGALDAVIARAIALDPADRFQRGRDLADALQAVPRG